MRLEFCFRLIVAIARGIVLRTRKHVGLDQISRAFQLALGSFQLDFGANCCLFCLGYAGLRNRKSLLGRPNCVARILNVVQRSLSSRPLRFLAGLQLRRVDAHQRLAFGDLIAWIYVDFQNAARNFAGQLNVTDGPDFAGCRNG